MTDPTGVFDDPKYAALALANRQQYIEAGPFPHIGLDNFLDEDLVKNLGRAFPENGKGEGWVPCDKEETRKHYIQDESYLPSVLRLMFREFNSPKFLLFMETLTGIEGLIPDPYLIGGGAHVSGPGDYLNIHVDFNWHHKLLAWRRVNAIFYLNDVWDKEWGGAIELWDKEMESKVKEYYPIFNRLVVFSTSQHSNHGHPHPLNTPPRIYRKALNIYFYTRQNNGTYDGGEDVESVDLYWTRYKKEGQVDKAVGNESLGAKTENSPFAMGLGENYRKLGESHKNSTINTKD
jgi:Rps23 Pro-64 3,4-dihydroxylase Tpa1-like proline 4-hydroxylase